jgi:hypothetical protein
MMLPGWVRFVVALANLSFLFAMTAGCVEHLLGVAARPVTLAGISGN